VARIALTSDDADRSVQFYAHGSRPSLPDSDEVVSEAYVVIAAEAPVGIQVTQKDASVCALTELNPGQTIGAIEAKVADSPRAVSIVGQQRCVILTRADAGKDVVFSATASMTDQVESQALDSDPFTVQVADKPVIKLSQKGKLISVLIRFKPGQALGLTTYTIGKSAPVVFKPVKGKFTLKLKPANVGKKIVVKTSVSQAGYMSSALVSSAPLKLKK